MTFSKTFVQAVDLADLERRLRDAAVRSPPPPVEPIDLDDVERRLRDVASSVLLEPSSAPNKRDDALAELALMVGRTKQPLGIIGGSDQAAPAAPALPSVGDGPLGSLQTAGSDADQGRFDLETSIAATRRANPPHAGGEPQLAQGNERQAEHGSAPAAKGRSDRPSDDGVRNVEAMATARLDGVVRVPAVPHSGFARHASARRSVVSRTARSLAAPLVFVTIGIGAAMVIAAGPPGEAPAIDASDAPVKAQTATVAGDDQAPSRSAPGPAGSPGKPDQSVVPAEQQANLVAAPTGDAEKTQAPASSGPALASKGPVVKADDASVKAQPTNPFGDDQQLSQSAPGPADSSDKPNQSAMLTEQPTTAVAATTARSGQAEPIQAPAPSAPVIVSGPVSADLPPPAPSSAEMAPALAAGVAPAPVVGPSVGSNAKPREPRQTSARSTAITSADTTAPLAAPSATRSAIPAVRKPALATRAQPAAIIAADHSQTMTMLNPLATPTKPGGGDRAASAPLPITPQGFPDRLADASAAPAQAAQPAATTEARANATGGSSLWVGVASSYSESDARATLSQLQKQFPGRLGGGSISRDDRGGAGVFYRVRVGPLSLESAAKVCSRLRAAGKNCVLTRS